MSDENPKDKTGAIIKLVLFLCLAAALIGGFNIAVGICFILLSLVFLFWARACYATQEFYTRFDSVSKKKHPILYWLGVGFITMFGIASFCLSIFAFIFL